MIFADAMVIAWVRISMQEQQIVCLVQVQWLPGTTKRKTTDTEATPALKFVATTPRFVDLYFRICFSNWHSYSVKKIVF